MRRRRSRLSFEHLEARRLLANLALTDVFLLDMQGNRLEAPVEGQSVGVTLFFRTIDLPSGVSYLVRRELNGLHQESRIDWGAGVNGEPQWFAAWPLGQLRAGENVIEIRLDAGDEISEADEFDNVLTLRFGLTDSRDPTFLNPLGGVPNRDWAIGNWVDLDPGPGWVDYRGNPFTYNGHDAHDIGLAAVWEQQDAGTPVYASAGGIVIGTLDGGDDRCGHPTANACGAGNLVSVDHGGGWSTHYLHLRKGSVAVTTGERVATGQFLGFVGSSGNSSGPHLHWAVYHQGTVVEPYLRAAELLADPLPYVGEAPGIMDFYTTAVGASFHDRPELAVFRPGESPLIWIATQGITAGVAHDVIWYRPDGSEHFRWHNTSGSFPLLALVSGLSAELGTWTVATEIDGVRQAEMTFLVSPLAQPDVSVTHLANNFTLVPDGATIPVRFDPVSPGRTGSTRTFTVRNVGNAALETSGLSIPPGFTLVEGLSGTIAPSEEDTFTVQLDTGSAGLKSGVVTFQANDPDEPVYRFAIEGWVIDLALAVSAESISEDAGAGALWGTVSRPIESLAEPLTVYLEVSERSEAAVPLRVTIPGGEREATFPIDIVDDVMLDGPRRVLLTGSLIGNVSTAVEFEVLDHEFLQLDINFDSVPEDAGPGELLGTVTRSDIGNLNRPLIVNLESRDANYLRLPPTVTIPAGQSTATFALEVIDNLLATGDQRIGITARREGYTAATAEVLVVDDESPSLRLSWSSSTMAEGGEIQLTVTRNTPPSGPLQVRWTANPANQVDVPEATVIFEGTASAVVNVTAIDNDLVDGLRMVTLTATTAGFPTAASPISILDDDTAALTLTLAADELAEDGGVMEGTIARNTPPLFDLEVRLLADSEDVQVPPTVVIPAGARSVRFPITVRDNVLAEGDRQVRLDANATGFQNGSAVLNLRDNERAALELTLAVASRSERDGTTTAIVRRNTPPTTDLLVQLRSDHSDAVPATLSIRIPAGSEAAEFSIEINDDFLAQGDRQIVFTVETPEFEPATANLALLDDDSRTLSLVLAVETLPENGGRTSGTVSRNTPLDELLEVTLSPDSPAVMAPMSLTFAPGMALVEFTLMAVDDDVATGDRIVQLQASADDFVSGATQVTIVDDERPRLVVELSALQVEERVGVVRASVHRNTPPEVALEVRLAATPGGLARLPELVVIPAGGQSATFEVRFDDDDLALGAQRVTITATAASLESGFVEFTILDDEMPQLVATLSSTSISELHGRAMGTILRNTPYPRDLAVTLTSSAPGALRVESEIVFPGDALSVPWTASAIDNDLLDGPRTVLIHAAANGFGGDTAMLNITDFEVLLLEVSLPQLTRRGGVTTVTVRRGNLDIEEALQVFLEIGDETIARTSASVVIPALAAAATFVVSPGGDVSAETRTTTLRASTAGYESADVELRLVNGNTPPERIVLSGTTVYENIRGLVIGTLTVEDADAEQTHGFSVADPRFEITGTMLKLADDQHLDLDREATIHLEITTTDSGTPPESLVRIVALQVLANPLSWQNRPVALNIDGDPADLVAPIDALLIINLLNDPGELLDDAGRLPRSRPLHSTQPYYDADGDGFVSPLDALLVINHLNRGPADGESAVSFLPDGGRMPLDEWDSRRRRIRGRVGDDWLEDLAWDVATRGFVYP